MILIDWKVYFFGYWNFKLSEMKERITYSIDSEWNEWMTMKILRKWDNWRPYRLHFIVPQVRFKFAVTFLTWENDVKNLMHNYFTDRFTLPLKMQSNQMKNVTNDFCAFTITSGEEWTKHVWHENEIQCSSNTCTAC